MPGRCLQSQPVNPSCVPVPVFSRCTTLFHKSLTHCACPVILSHSCAAFTARRLKNNLLKASTLQSGYRRYWLAITANTTTQATCSSSFYEWWEWNKMRAVYSVWALPFLFKEIQHFNRTYINRNITLEIPLFSAVPERTTSHCQTWTATCLESSVPIGRLDITCPMPGHVWEAWKYGSSFIRQPGY